MSEEMKTTPNSEQVIKAENPLVTSEAETAAAEAPVQEEKDLVTRIEQLEAELAQMQDKFLRTAAELQNYRRRVEQEKQQLLEIGKALVLRPLLEVLDDLERSLEAVRQAGMQDASAAYQQLREGIELVYQKFLTELHRLGVQPIEAQGQPFDPELHEAVMQQPASESMAPGTVLQEVQKGYRLGERVLRHSQVIVAAPPSGNSQA